MAELYVKKVSLSDVYQPTTDFNLRQHQMTDEEAIQMAISIKERGMTNLPKLRISDPAETDKPYTLADGNLRFTGLKILENEGYLDSHNFIIDEAVLTKRNRLIEQITSNANSKKTQSKEYINAILLLTRDENMSASEIATMLSISEKQVFSLLKTVKLPDAQREQLATGELSLGAACELSKLVNKVSPEQFDAMVETAKESSISDLGSKINETLANLAEEKKKASSDSSDENDDDFVALPKFVGKTEAEGLLSYYQMIDTPTDFENGARYILEKLFSIDVDSVAARKAEYEAKKKEAEDKRLAKKAQKDVKTTEALIAELKARGISI